MTTTQSLILDRIAEKLEGQGLVVAIDFSYNNVGTIRTLTESLNLVSQLSFNFQDDRFEFKGQQRPIVSYAYGRVRQRGMAAYVMDSIPQAITTVCDYLNG